MKFLLIAILFALSFSVGAEARKPRHAKKAKKITCINSGDGVKYSAIFRGVGTTKNTVELVVPSGKRGKTLKGNCDPKDGSIELDVECSLKMGEDENYSLALVSPNGAELAATVTHSSGETKDEPVSLECENK